MINDELDDQGLELEVLTQVFDMWYPKLEEKINEELENHSTTNQDGDIRSEKDILEEILSLSRETSMIRNSSKKFRTPYSPKMLDEFIYTFEKLIRDVHKRGYIELIPSLERVLRVFEYFLEEMTYKSDMPKSMKKELMHKFDKTRMRLSDIRHMTQIVEKISTPQTADSKGVE